MQSLKKFRLAHPFFNILVISFIIELKGTQDFLRLLSTQHGMGMAAADPTIMCKKETSFDLITALCIKYNCFSFEQVF